MTRSTLEGIQGLQGQQDHETVMVPVPVLVLQLDSPQQCPDRTSLSPAAALPGGLTSTPQSSRLSPWLPGGGAGLGLSLSDPNGTDVPLPSPGGEGRTGHRGPIGL